MKRICFSYAKETKPNPFMGICSFQHARKDPLYSDLIVRPENNLTETEHVECYPIPSYVEQKGREQGCYPDSSVAYFRFLWKEFEPREGEYRYEFIEEIIKKARENGQTLLLRMMPHSTRESDDVPLWLKEKIPCPARPEGKRVKDSPTDPRFLIYFGRAIRALGDRFDSDPTLAFFDLSLPGAWGEGSDVGRFSEEELRALLACYTEAFSHTALIGQVAVPWLKDCTNGNFSMGWRADCIGPERLLSMVKSQSEQWGEQWKTGHVSFEAYWWLGEWKRQGWDVNALLEQMLSWHVSSFNAKSLPIPPEWKEAVEAFISKMGYHFVIREAAFDEHVSQCLSVALSVENIGVAPLYHPLSLNLKLKGKREVVFTADIDLRTWLPGLHEEHMDIFLPDDLPAGEYELQIGMGGDGLPSAVFATDAPQDGDWSVLGRVFIEE